MSVPPFLRRILMYEVNCYDSGILSFTSDLEVINVGDRFQIDGIEIEVTSIILIDEESRIADVEIAYCL